MASAIIEFLEALNRLVERGVKPTFDAVAIEAGRKKGSIRRGLDRHKELVTAIAKAAKQFEKEAEQSNEFKQTARIEKLKKEKSGSCPNKSLWPLKTFFLGELCGKTILRPLRICGETTTSNPQLFSHLPGLIANFASYDFKHFTR